MAEAVNKEKMIRNFILLIVVKGLLGFNKSNWSLFLMMMKKSGSISKRLDVVFIFELQHPNIPTLPTLNIEKHCTGDEESSPEILFTHCWVVISKCRGLSERHDCMVPLTRYMVLTCGLKRGSEIEYSLFSRHYISKFVWWWRESRCRSSFECRTSGYFQEDVGDDCDIAGVGWGCRSASKPINRCTRIDFCVRFHSTVARKSHIMPA